MFPSTEILLLVTNSENLGATWAQGFIMKVESCMHNNTIKKYLGMWLKRKLGKNLKDYLSSALTISNFRKILFMYTSLKWKE